MAELNFRLEITAIQLHCKIKYLDEGFRKIGFVPDCRNLSTDLHCLFVMLVLKLDSCIDVVTPGGGFIVVCS